MFTLDRERVFTLDCRDGGIVRRKGQILQKADFLSSKDLKLLPILREANDHDRKEEQ